MEQLKRLGLSAAPKLAIGDGSLGFWIALQEEYGPIAQQRCWVHKTANILDKLPKSVQGKAKQLIHEMYLAPTRKAALAAYDQFISSYQTKFPKACECLEKDKEVLFTFYDFPAQHWPHLRTTNPIESTFATVRLRTNRTKGSGSRIATLTMVFKLGQEAQKHWRRLQGFELIQKVVTGVRFVDGEEQTQQALNQSFQHSAHGQDHAGSLAVQAEFLRPDHVTTTDFQSALSEDHHRPALRIALSKYPGLKGLS